MLNYISSTYARWKVGEADWRTPLAVVLTLTFWASAFAGIRAGLHSYTPSSVALLRYLTASLVLAVYAWLSKMPLPNWRDLPGLALSGVFGIALYNVALNTGEQQIAAGTASLIVASAPIYVALLAVLLLHERLAVWGWLGILLSFAGVAVISLAAGKGLELSLNAFIVLAAAIAQSIYVILQKPYLKRYSPLQCTACAIWGATLLLLVFSPGLAGQIRTASAESTLAVLYMGVFPGAIGYVSWAFVLSRLPASKAGSLLYMVPAIAILIAWLWLGEIPTLLAILGGILVLAGVILVNMLGKSRVVR